MKGLRIWFSNTRGIILRPTVGIIAMPAELVTLAFMFGKVCSSFMLNRQA